MDWWPEDFVTTRKAFFVVAGNFDYDQKKKRYSRLLAGNWQFFCCGGKFSLRPKKKKIQSSVWRACDQLRPEKKRYSRLSVGCAVLAITTSFFVVAGNFYYDRKKKRYSHLSGGCAIIITTKKKKKKFQSSVWRVHDHIEYWSNTFLTLNLY